MLYAANVPSFFHKFLLPFADHFRANGWRVDAMSKGFDEYRECDLRDHFDNVWEVDWARKPHELHGLANIVRHIQSVVQKADYDLIHVHTPVAAMVTRFALRKKGRDRRTKILYTAHGFHFFQGAPKVSSTVFHRLEEMASQWTDYLIVMNAEDYAAAQRLKSLAKDRVIYMPGIGVDLHRYRGTSEHRTSMRCSLGIEPEEIAVLCVAEFIPRKRHLDLLHALKRLSDRRVRVVFAGDGETLPAMQEKARELGLADQTLFLGLRLDIPQLLAAADLCVLASGQEGLPRSVMEAMCAGVPVIAADIRGCRDLLSDGIGTLYPPGDVASLAAAIQRFVNDPGASRPGTILGMQQVQKYDIQAVLQMHEHVYASALGVERDLIIPSPARLETYLS